MRTKLPTVRREVSLDELQSRAAQFSAAHPGFDATNYVDAFRDDDGQLDEGDDFFAASALFTQLAYAERER